MKGLYLNVPGASTAVRAFDRLLNLPSSILDFEHAAVGSIVLSFRPGDWPDGPVFQSLEHRIFAAASGWLCFNDRLGALGDFALAFSAAQTSAEISRVLAGIQGGAFVLLIIDGDGFKLVTDPFGLHPHYVRRSSSRLQLAPAPSFLRAGASQDVAMSEIMRHMNHPVGDRTGYAGIQRLSPGSVISAHGRALYFDYSPTRFDPVAITTELRVGRGWFGDRPAILPISGGLDSRLLLATGPFDYGFTFGPEESGDRPIARSFRHYFRRDYDAFSLSDLRYPDRLAKAADVMFDGICPAPFREILAAFERLVGRWGSGLVFFDGYLGDVLTRGTWLNLPSMLDRLIRPFPGLRLWRANADDILRRRYREIDDDAYREVRSCFAAMVEGQEVPHLIRVLVFEMLYGRGARYIVNGNATMAGQFFTPVQPFFFPSIFRRLIAIPPNELLSFRALHALWRDAPHDLRHHKTLDGYAPSWPPAMSRVAGWLHSLFGRVRPSLTYSDELRGISWDRANEATDIANSVGHG